MFDATTALRRFINFYKGFTWLHWVLPGFTGFYWVLLGFTGFYCFTVFFWFLPGFTGFYWVLLGFTGFYWVLLSLTGLRWVLLRYTGFGSALQVVVLVYSGFDRVCWLLLIPIRFYRVLRVLMFVLAFCLFYFFLCDLTVFYGDIEGAETGFFRHVER